MQRYYKVDASRRQNVMSRLGNLLRKFRYKVYDRDIKPYLHNMDKL